MIVVAAFLVALGKPSANGAMRDRFWICFDAVWRCVAQPFKACFDVSAISGVFRETIRFRLELFRGSDDVHPFRKVALYFGYEFRIKAKLKNCGAFGFKR
jgi:hypothetical protein